MTRPALDPTNAIQRILIAKRHKPIDSWPLFLEEPAPSPTVVCEACSQIWPCASNLALRKFIESKIEGATQATESALDRVGDTIHRIARKLK